MSTAVVTLLGLAARWGTLGADVRNLKRRTTTTESDLARVSAAQSTAAAQAAKVDATLDAMRTELARLARAPQEAGQFPPREPLTPVSTGAGHVALGPASIVVPGPCFSCPTALVDQRWAASITI